MPDGRRIFHARTTALTITTLTTVGLGLATANPATAAPAPDDRTVQAAQSKVNRLAGQAGAAEDRHETAQTKVERQRARAQKLTAAIKRHKRLVDSLRTQVVSTVVDQYGASGASVLPAELSPDSKQLLTNVTVVSEDTGGRAEAMAKSAERVQELAGRRAEAREAIPGLRRVAQAFEARETRADARLASASTVLNGLQERREQARLAAQEKAQEKAAAEASSASSGSVVGYAKAQVGKSYVYGAAGPSSFDCSGLTMMAWKQAGVSLPHNSTAQYASGTKVSESELQPGDLVFYYSPISHVGLYVGGGQVVNALNPGSGIQVSGLHDMPYVGAVRPG